MGPDLRRGRPCPGPGPAGGQDLDGEVDDAVAQGEANRDLRVVGHVHRQKRRQAVGAERDRGVDPQFAPGSGSAIGSDGLGRLQLRQHEADLFISIHADAFINPQANGSSVWVLSQRGSTSQAARWLAAAIEVATHGFPTPVRDEVPVNATVPAVPADEVPRVLARYDGCTTAKVKVAERGQTLADDGAHVQRPLWASTGVKDPSLPDTLYVTELAAPNTVNTMPPKTLAALADHGTVEGDRISGTYDEAKATMDALEHAGVSYADVVDKLETEGLDKFEKSWEELLGSVRSELEKAGENK